MPNPHCKEAQKCQMESGEWSSGESSSCEWVQQSCEEQPYMPPLCWCGPQGYGYNGATACPSLNGAVHNFGSSQCLEACSQAGHANDQGCISWCQTMVGQGGVCAPIVFRPFYDREARLSPREERKFSSHFTPHREERKFSRTERRKNVEHKEKRR